MRRQAGMREVGQHDGQRVLRADLRVAVRSHHAQGRLAAGVHERGQQVEGVDGRPLQVVKKEQRPRRTGHVDQEACHRLEHEAPLLVR